MLPAQPPHSRRMSLIWNDTDSMCVCSGRMCRAKRSGNTMIVSNASEPQISVRIGAWQVGRAEAAPRESVAQAMRRRGSPSASASFDSATRRVGLARRLALPSIAAVARRSRRYATAPFIASRPISRTMYCWRRDTGSDSAMPCSSTSQCASPSSFDAPLEAADEVARDEAIAVDAHEARAELLFEPRQRFLEQVLALRRADRDVLELGLQIDDFVDRDEHDARALGDRQEAPRRGRQLGELLDRHGLQSRHLLQCGQQSLHAHRLDQVVDGVDLERLPAHARETPS